MTDTPTAITPFGMDLLRVLAGTATGEKYLKGADRHIYLKLVPGGFVEEPVRYSDRLKGKITDRGREATRA